MTSRFQFYSGCIILVLGLFLLAHPDFHRRLPSEPIVVGNQTTNLETQEVYSIPRPASALLAMFGVLLIVNGKKPQTRKLPSRGKRK